MRLSTKSTILLVVLLAGVLPCLASFAAHLYVGHTPHRQEPLHEWFELAGSCIALGVAMLLLLHLRHADAPPHLVWVAAALAAMGAADMMHSVAHFGTEWSWLHHGATFTGGVVFGLIWLPLPAPVARHKQLWVLIVAGLAVLGSIAIWAQAVPLPAPWGPEGYTLAPKVVNALGGLGFLSAALFFLRRFLRLGHTEDAVFGSCTLLFGTAGLLFAFSAVWTAGWWIWHGARLAAYVIVLASAYEMVTGLHEKIARHAQELEDRVRARTAELREREEISRSAFANAAIGFAMTAPDGRFVDANPAYCRLTGYSIEELRALEFSQLVHPEDRAENLERIHRMLAGEIPDFTIENRYLRKGGQTLWVRKSVSLVRTADGQPQWILALIEDISARRHAEEALRAGEERYRRLFESMAEGFALHEMIFDDRGQPVDYRFLEVNPAFGQLTGLDPGAILGKTVREVIPEVEPSWIETYGRVVKTGQSERFERYIAPLDHWYDVFAYSPASGQFATAFTDITPRKRAEEALRKSEARLRLAQASAGAGMWNWDISSGKLEWSEELFHLFGLDSKKVEAGFDLWSSALHPDDRRAAEERIQAAIAGRSPLASEYRVVLPSGEVRWINALGNTTYDEAGRPLRMAGICIDITERKWTEEQLRRSREDLDRAQEVGQIGWWRLDVRRNVLTWSDENYRIFGAPVGTPLSYESFLGIVHPDDRAYVDAKWSAGLRGEPYDIEHRIIADEGVKWVREKAYLEFDQGGALLGGFGITQDISARKSAEEELRRSEEERKVVEAVRAERQRLFDVLETLPAMICLLTQDYHVAFANRSFRERFGDLAGRRCHEWRFGHERPCDFCETYNVLTTGKPHHWEVNTADGSVIDTYDFPFTDADGSRMILEMGLDITERRRTEKALQRAHEDLEERAAQLRALAGELTLSGQRERQRLAQILHDHLQQLLVAAKMRTATMAPAGDEIIRQAAAEIAHLIDEAITASRHVTAELSPPILHEGGLPAGLMWLARRMADRHGLRVDLVMEEDLPPLGEAVGLLLFESVRELLFNAVKHAQVATATVNVRRIAADAIGITVSDPGPGFDPDTMKKAGETGGGFGLFSIRERLELLGGRMDVDSAPGQGSRFTLTAPAGSEPCEAPLTVQVPLPPTRDETPVAVEAPGGGAPIRVLVADDHAVVREGLRRLLGQDPAIRVAGEAIDGQEAVDLAAKLRPDVILMDLNMPKLDGVEATRAIHNSYPEIRIIGLSMYQEADWAQAMRAAGAADYLSKSDPPRNLLSAIHRACQPPATTPDPDGMTRRSRSEASRSSDALPRKD